MVITCRYWRGLIPSLWPRPGYVIGLSNSILTLSECKPLNRRHLLCLRDICITLDSLLHSGRSSSGWYSPNTNAKVVLSRLVLLMQVHLDPVPILPTHDACPDRYVWLQREEIDRALSWSGCYF